MISLVGIHGFQFDHHADRWLAPFSKNTLFMMRTRIKGNSNVEALLPKAAVPLCDVQPRDHPNDNGTNNIRKGPFSLARWNRLLVSSSEQRPQDQNEKLWVGPLWNRQRRIQRMEDEDTAIRKWRRRIRRPTAHQRSNGTNGIANSRDTGVAVKVSDRRIPESWQVTQSYLEGNVRQSPSSFPENMFTPDGGKRVQFSAQHLAKRSLQELDETLLSLLHEYMTQPVEQYSLLSFHEQLPHENKTTIQSRRWVVRRLTASEAAFYHSQEDSFDSGSGKIRAPEIYFRLAVPLMPLVGLDLTPVIDLSVDVINNNNKTDRTSPVVDDRESTQLFMEGRRRWRWKRGEKSVAAEVKQEQEPDQVRIRSLRVALLSTDAEVKLAMKGKDDRQNPHNKQSSGRNPYPATSNNQNVKQRVGYEAIGMVGSLEKIIKPHVSFQAVISWSPSSSDINKEKNPFINVKTAVETSMTIPTLPIPRFPSSFVFGNVGSMLTKKALTLVLPHFLKKLEDDFRRWASTPSTDVAAQKK